MEVASWACIILGSFFTIVGMLGLLRMPELFTRMHSASVMETRLAPVPDAQSNGSDPSASALLLPVIAGDASGG